VGEAMPMVERVADWLSSRYRGTLERDELVSLGYEGLVQAARRFEASMGVPFEGYAWSRVHGAMMSAIAKEISFYRIAREAGYKVMETLRDDGNLLTDSEESHQKRLDDFAGSLLAALLTGIVRSGAADIALGPEGQNVAREEYQRAVSVLSRAMARLPEAEQMLIRRHYYDDALLKDIAGELSMSYATVRRRHHEALRRLGRELRDADVGHDALSDMA
jgi:RNA polymerase sigma factor FliA